MAEKIKTLLNFKNDFNLTNSTVQIQIVFMDKKNLTKNGYKILYQNSSNCTNTSLSKPHRKENMAIIQKVQIGNQSIF